MRSQLVQWRRGCAPPVLECRRLIERNGAKGRRFELSETPARRGRMSASGQFQTSARVRLMSALLAIADIPSSLTNVGFVPRTDLTTITCRLATRRVDTLKRLDRMIEPAGAVALFHDSAPAIPANGWRKVWHDICLRSLMWRWGVLGPVGPVWIGRRSADALVVRHRAGRPEGWRQVSLT